LYEGFGLTALESMACGTPVVGANRSSIPEVVGDAGLLVDPLNEAHLASALDRIVRDGELRSLLASQGRVRAARFTWSACAAAIERAVGIARARAT
jgi:glycosyltransferase involved in cell wall biosynthesis